ncbi:MAG: c-type cytochrome, partial [Gammaproteobacteria bacterium]
MTKILASGTILALSCGAATLVQAAGDPEAGKALFAVCAACHGANGEGN